MQEKQLYEYAVIRVVPNVEREEFMNVGVIVFCKRSKFLAVSWQINEARFACFSNGIELDQIQRNLEAFERITIGSKDGGRIALLDAPERFRWLTAIRSSVIQTSRPHPGYSSDLQATLKRLMEELVY